MFNLMSIVLVFSFLNPQSFASIGNSSGGGGEEEEIKVSEIREDILKWIEKGGAEKLDLKGQISYSEYKEKMLKILKQKNVIVGFVENDNSNEEELKVSVNSIPKTCRGFVSKKNSTPHIICNIQRFKNTSESGKYKLIHHEFAGLSLLEKNEDAASDYFISSQITDFLEKKIVLRLSIKKQNQLNEYLPTELFGEYPAKYYCDKTPYQDIKCVVPTLDELETIITNYKNNTKNRLNLIKTFYSQNDEYKSKLLKMAEVTSNEIGANFLSSIYQSYVKNYDQLFGEKIFSDANTSIEKITDNISLNSSYLKQLIKIKEAISKDPSDTNYFRQINDSDFTTSIFNYSKSINLLKYNYEKIKPSFEFNDLIKLDSSCTNVKGKGKGVATSIVLKIFQFNQLPDSGFDPIIDYKILKELLASNYSNPISVECSEINLNKIDLDYKSDTLIPKYDSKNKKLAIPYFINREFSTTYSDFDYNYKKEIIYYDYGSFLNVLRGQLLKM